MIKSSQIKSNQIKSNQIKCIYLSQAYRNNIFNIFMITFIFNFLRDVISVIWSEPPCKDGDALFTTIPLNRFLWSSICIELDISRIFLWSSICIELDISRIFLWSSICLELDISRIFLWSSIWIELDIIFFDCMSDQNSGPICLKFWLGNWVDPRECVKLI